MKRLKKLAPFLLPFLAIAGVIGYVAWRTRRIPMPRRKWKRYDKPNNIPLNASGVNALQGIYAIEDGADFFGDSAVVKCSYTIEKEGTDYHLSFFCKKNGAYILFQGKQDGDHLLIKGHWRKAAANGKGLVWMVMENGVEFLHNPSGAGHYRLQGWYGYDDEKPRKPVTMQFQSPLPEVPLFDIIGHRGGGRNVDFLSISENTTGMAKLAARLGANGIEIDVRMTKDNVPVIFHDSFFSIHTIQNLFYGGLLHNHTLAEVKKLELRNLGEIPTLEEMLHTVLYQTPLEVVWLDIKKECDLEQIVGLQREYQQRAAAMDRKLTIYIGIPDEYILRCFKDLENYRDIPSLIELDWNLALDINAQVWAPQYTGGLQTEDTDKVHAAGKKAYVWSLDTKFMIETYIGEGTFDGLVTNTAPVVAHWYYTEGYKMRKKQAENRELPIVNRET